MQELNKKFKQETVFGNNFWQLLRKNGTYSESSGVEEARGSERADEEE